MNKSLLVGVSAFLFAATTLHAAVDFGIKGGMNYNSNSSTISSEADLNKESITGLQFGGVADYKLSDTLSIQGEILYSQKGVKFTGDIAEIGFSMSYLEVPIVAKLRVDKTFSVYGGGYVAYLSNGTMDYPVGENMTTTVKIKNFYEDFDYGVIIGGQAKISDRMSIDLRYTLGLANTFKSSNSFFGEESESLSGENSSISISTTYMF